MRCCPKCGERYSDDDFRTMCASCFVSLVPCADNNPVLPQASQAESTPSSIPTTQKPVTPMAEIPMPTIPTEVPQITPPPIPVQPEPEPNTPTTPQPDPEYPQPTIIPTPTPTPTPEPAPIPHPAEPVPTAKKSVPAAVRSTAYQQNASAPVRRLSQEEQSSGKLASVLFAIGGILSGIIAAVALFSTSAANFGFFDLLFDGGLIFLGVYLIRQAIYRSAVQRATMKVTKTPCLNAPLQFNIEVGLLKTIAVTEGTLTVTAEEEAIQGHGKHRSTYRHTLFTRSIPLNISREWREGSLVMLNPQLTLPNDAMPSFTGVSNTIRWKAQLWIGIPGMYPDIRLHVPLTILPIRRVETLTAVDTPQRYSLPYLGDLQATIQLDCAADAKNVPTLLAGRKIPFALEITPQHPQNHELCFVELSYRIAGAGNPEALTVDRVECFRRGWQQGVTQRDTGMLTVPVAGPLSYPGKYIRIDWMICVLFESPRKRDARRQFFEVHIVPDEVLASRQIPAAVPK